MRGMKAILALTGFAMLAANVALAVAADFLDDPNHPVYFAMIAFGLIGPALCLSSLFIEA